MDNKENILEAYKQIVKAKEAYQAAINALKAQVIISDSIKDNRTANFCEDKAHDLQLYLHFFQNQIDSIKLRLPV